MSSSDLSTPGPVNKPRKGAKQTKGPTVVVRPSSTGPPKGGRK